MGIVGKVVNAKQVETAAAVVKKATAASAPAAPAAAAVPPEIALYMRGAAWLLPQVADVAALEVVVARGEAGARAAAMTALAAVKGGTDIVAALVAAHPGHETVAARAAGELLGCLVASEGVKVCGVLKAAAGNKKDMVERESAYLASAAMCAFGGHAVEPWAVAEVVPLLLGGFDDAKEEVKLAARAGAKAVGHALSGRAVRLCMASLYPALESTAKPKVKIAALNLISALCADKPEGLEYELPDLIPLLIEALSDTKAAVQYSPGAAARRPDAATVTLAEACGLVRTPETVKLMPLFLAAITHPDSMTTKALEALMDITFCNALGSDSLAILVPVMLRGLRTGEADLTKCACKAACNMLELVASPEVLMCFNDRMIPEFVKTENHAYPEIRELGSMHDLRTGLIGAETLAEQRTRAKAGKEEILSAFASYSNAASVPPVAVAFLASLASGEVSGTLSISQNVFSAHELEAATRKALHGALDEAALTSLSAHLHTAYAGTYHRKEMGEEGGDEDDNIVNLPNIICGFAGRVLLRRATFKLERGQIYGLVGQNARHLRLPT
ncbi:armadillo-type protein [Pavlovales sp. CCMP2436]|nr:armadillo-type protein [Pavlovales sp. CCMP2436]